MSIVNREPQPELEYEVAYVRQLHDAIIHDERHAQGGPRKAYRKTLKKQKTRQSEDAFKNFRVDPVQRDSTYMGSCVPTTRSTSRHVEYQPTAKSIAFNEELRLRRFLRDNLRQQDQAILARLDCYLQPLCERAKQIKEAMK